ncbi:MAG: metalloregulator ArsR/SmtB family transcription factor [Gemmatimonadetes bacterium]|nr:metalloregulator ArsR/SmtB family transcription factor [Gemmatimonadota bacterium]
MDPVQHRMFKSKLFQLFGRIAKALANARRLELLDLLAQSERTVEELAWETGMSVANTSQHLQALRHAGLVEVRRESVYAYYRMADEFVYRALQVIRDLAEERLAELDRVVSTYLGDRDKLEALGAEELLQRTREGKVVVLDVRPEDEYLAAHIPGARSVPVSRLEDYLGQLPADADVVAYCRGRYCVFADEAVALLRAHGFSARRLKDGLPDWRAAGLPVATGELPDASPPR